MIFYSGGKNVYFKRIYIKLNLEIFLIFLFVVQRKAVQNLAAFCRAISIPALEAVLAETLQFHQCICPCIVYARLLLLLLSFMSVSSWEFGCKFCFFFLLLFEGLRWEQNKQHTVVWVGRNLSHVETVRAKFPNLLIPVIIRSLGLKWHSRVWISFSSRKKKLIDK